MKSAKKLGIWMDNSSAHIMEFSTDKIETHTIESKFTHQEKEESLSKSENLMHNKEQQQQGAYYKNLGEVIKNYSEVLIFGPTNAKLELVNTLKEDHHFDDIKIETKSADRMTEHQEHAYVKDYFSKP